MSTPPRRPRARVAIPVDPLPKPSLVPFEAEVPWEEQPLIEEAITDKYFVTFEAGVSADLDLAVATLSKIALFQGVPPNALEVLGLRTRQGEIPNGEYLFQEGTNAGSFFVVLDGAVEILRQTEEREVTLRQMNPGEAVGLFGLFAGHRRAASARAVGDVLVLEVPYDALSELLLRVAFLHDRLVKVYRERLVEGFLATSPLFSDLDSTSRARVLSLFEEKRIKPGDALMQPGEVFNLFAIVVQGRLLLEQRLGGGQEPTSAEIQAGEYVAVLSALLGEPTRTRLHASEETAVSMLNHRDFSELLKDFPALRQLTVRLPEVARKLDRDVFSAEAASGMQ